MATFGAIDPLASLTRLSPNVYLEEKSSTPSANGRHGTTIILCTWLNASPKNISTYISGYKRLDSTVRIVLIRTTLPNVIYRATASQKRNLRPVVDALCARPNDSVLVHVFSNAGAQQLCVLAALYRDTTGRLLPVQAIVHDSSPSKGTFSRARSMLMYELPRQLYLRVPGMVLIYLLLFLSWFADKIFQRQNILNKTRNDLNNTQLIPKAAEKVYIYSKQDALVRWEDVEEHRHDAAAKGWSTIKEEFNESHHVRHVKVDPDRYWAISRRLLMQHRRKR